MFQSQLAVGSVGWFIKNTPIFSFGQNSAYASLVKPPFPFPFEKQVNGVQQGLPQSDASILNLDASHFEYLGSALAGGAHSDIFKDDLLNLFWAVVRLGRGDAISGDPAS